MSNLSNLNYENIPNPFNSSMEREGGLLGSPGMVDLGEAGEYERSISKEIHGNDLDDLWINSWIKSRNYKPKTSGFLIDGKLGYIECMKLHVGKGGIVGGKIDIPDITTANSAHIEADGDTYWGCNVAGWATDNDNANAYVLKTGVAKFQNITITGGTIGGQSVSNVGYVSDSATDVVPIGLAQSDNGISTGNDGSQSAYVVLTWDAISTNTFDHYLIRYKKNALTYYTYIPSNTNTIIIEGLTPNISYNFGIASVNRYGAVSAYSTNITQTTASDSVAPITVTSDSATGGIQYIVVEWTHNTESDLASYNIYRHTANDSGSAVLIGNSRTNYFVDGDRVGGTTYYYWIKAVDTSGNVSASFSTVQSAAPRNVENADVTVGIAAEKILIDGVVYLTNWRHGSDLTKIDGGDIYAGSVTTTQLNFTPVQSTNVIASINASAEGITIDADNLTIAAVTTFTAGWAAASNAEEDINVLNTVNAPAAANADVTQTIIDGGMITTGYITLNTAGHIKSGQTAYETGTGWWLGNDSGTPKFSIGSASNYFKWNGTNIVWKGANTELDASGNLIASSVTVSGALTTGAGSTINGGYVDSLNAGKITAGTMNAARIDGGDINGVTITGVTISGGTVRTGASGQRIVMTGDNLSSFSGNQTYAEVVLDSKELWFNMGSSEFGGGSGTKMYQSGNGILSVFAYTGALDATFKVVADASFEGIYTDKNLSIDKDMYFGLNRFILGNGIQMFKFETGFIRTRGNVVPFAPGVDSLGNISVKYKSLYLSDHIYLDSGKYIVWNNVQTLTHDGDVFKINDDLQPSVDSTYRLGFTNIAWYAVHSDNYLGCALPTADKGIDIFKKIKSSKINEGKSKNYHAGKRHYFDIDEFPDEMKMTDKDSGKKDIELTRTLGVTVSAVKELVEIIDDLKSRLKILELKTTQ